MGCSGLLYRSHWATRAQFDPRPYIRAFSPPAPAIFGVSPTRVPVLGYMYTSTLFSMRWKRIKGDSTSRSFGGQSALGEKWGSLSEYLCVCFCVCVCVCVCV